MKRLLLLLLLLVSPAWAANNFGPSVNSMLIQLACDGGTPTAYQVDSAWVFRTSGEAILVKFCSPVTQTNGNLAYYAYIPAAGVTGTPTFAAELRESASAEDDEDQPDDDADILATSADLVLGDAAESTWVTFSWTGSVSLTRGYYYWICIYNKSVDETAAYASFLYRGALDSHLQSATGGIFSFGNVFTTGYTSDGCTGGAPQAMNFLGCGVIAFGDGSVMGNPYVTSGAHANNDNPRGNRLTFAGKVTVDGIMAGIMTAAFTNVRIYTTTGATLVDSVALQKVAYNDATGTKFAPTNLTGGTAYDFCAILSAANTGGTIYTMGEAEGDVPAAVLAARPYSQAFVTGTPGSFTVDTSKIMGMAISIADIPLVEGGAKYRRRVIIAEGTMLAGIPLIWGLRYTWKRKRDTCGGARNGNV